MLPTIEQDPTHLSFGLLHDTPIHDLTVLQENQVKAGRWQFVFQIVGESHRVLIHENDKLCQQEVLACIPLVAAECEDHVVFSQLQDHVLQANRYQFNIRFSVETVPLFIQPDMEVWFPKVHGIAPVTQLRWADDGQMIQWWTLHLYPRAKQTVTVLTYSEFNYLQNIT